jgi:hemerythrin-like domain-containing protein
MDNFEGRRSLLTVAGAGALLAACQKVQPAGEGSASNGVANVSAASAQPQPKEHDEPEVGAVEDLMREHGVIRRVLVVYRETAIRLRGKGGSIAVDPLQKAAKLMRTFGEDYHEKQLEEAHIFPQLKKVGGAGAREIETLIAQHQRGREISEYVLADTQRPIAAANAEPLARALESFARMYEAHAAYEDSVLFPAWKKALSAKALDEMAELFESIEHKTFGKDGFDDATEQVAAIEKSLGIELAALNAAPPPKL